MAEKPNKNQSGSCPKLNEISVSNHRRTKSHGGILSDSISNLCKHFNLNGKQTNGLDAITPNSSRTTSTSTDTDNVALDHETTILNKATNCDCTNISIMHLFHEMKQEFPTIPDQIVGKHVNDNCHDRDNCLRQLRAELALHPSPVQSFPAKALQQLSPKKPLKPVRKAPTPTPTNEEKDNITNASWLYSNLRKNQQKEDHEAEQSYNESQLPRMRPTTLNLYTTQQQPQFQKVQVQLKQHIQMRNQQKELQQQQTEPIINKPIRRAPLPPVPPKPTHLNSPQVQYKSKATPTTTPSHSDISVNVSLTSPTSPLPYSKMTGASLPTTSTKSNYEVKASGSKSADQSPIRHRTVFNMQPQTHVRAFVNSSPTSPVNAAGQKSFTSVNLTLRQPNSKDRVPQGTIDIAAGPGVSGGSGSGLMYSSTSYNAQHGYQKTFNITVSDEGSEVHASRIRLPNMSISPSAHDNQFNSPASNNPMLKVESNAASNASENQDEGNYNLKSYECF